MQVQVCVCVRACMCACEFPSAALVVLMMQDVIKICVINSVIKMCEEQCHKDVCG